MTITHNQIVEALNNLRPTAEWTLQGDDYSEIVWTSDSTKPTLAEIETEIATIPIRKAQAEAAKVHERSALLAKLGITEEEAALLLGGN